MFPLKQQPSIMQVSIWFCTLIFLSLQTPIWASRQKRTLIYIPPGGVIQMVMGVGLPLVLNQESAIVGMVLKGGYNLPHNSTDFTNPGVVYQKRKRSVSRWDLYETMAVMSELHGIGGKECILRAICEVADVPLDKNQGLLEELLHVIFTPSATSEILNSNSDGIYHAAEQLGKDNVGHCNLVFPECHLSLTEFFTRFKNF